MTNGELALLENRYKNFVDDPPTFITRPVLDLIHDLHQAWKEAEQRAPAEKPGRSED